MRLITAAPTALAICLLLASCAAIPDEEKSLLNEPIDCSQAEQRVAALQEARPTEARKARILASSLTPGGLALGYATADIGDRDRVLSGAYAEQIDARIAQIRATCGAG